MAEITMRVPENVPGKFYTDSDCIDCGLCQEIAPDNFDMADNGYRYVHKQPADDSELQQVMEAMDSCPVETIGDDGE